MTTAKLNQKLTRLICKFNTFVALKLQKLAGKTAYEIETMIGWIENSIDKIAIVQDTVKSPQSNDYAFARQSAVQNLGEDLKDSARHKRNEWRGLEASEAEGTASEMITRKNLAKNEPLELANLATPETALSCLGVHLSMNLFPATPFKENRGHSSEQAKQYRSDYYAAYNSLKTEAETIVQNSDSDTIKLMARAAVKIIRELRATDHYHPVANGLVAIANGQKRAGKKYREFLDSFKEKYGDNAPDDLRLAVISALKGKSVNEIFEKVKESKDQYKPTESYVSVADRTGGEVIGDGTIQSFSKFLLESVGLRGVQFGNSATDGERKQHLQKAAEAFADLAFAANLPLKILSLSNGLGLAFGARGNGTALAHYEPATNIINLTRKGGVGSLAHECGHGLDKYLGGSTFLSNQGYRPNDPINTAMSQLFVALEDVKYISRLRKKLRTDIKEGIMSSGQYSYWTSRHEIFARTFERYVQFRLMANGRENTYLAGLRQYKELPDGLWVNDQELAAIAPKMDALMAAIRERCFNL